MANKGLRTALSIALLGLAIVSLTYMPQRALSAAGSIDFHSYWYAGIFLRQGQDPYRAYLLSEDPIQPVKFLDLPDQEFSNIAQPGLATVPANTSPIVLLLALSSWLSWPAARLLWLICNLILIPVAFGLVLLFTSKPQLDRWDYLILFTAFIALFGIRNTVGNGQTSLLIFCMMLLALILVDRKTILAGLLLGFALSKYSLALPVLLLFVLRKKTSPILVALAVQILAAMILSWHTGSSLMDIIGANIQIAAEHTSQPGIHLRAAFPAPIGEILLLLLTLLLGSIPIMIIYRRMQVGRGDSPISYFIDQQQFHLYHLFLGFLLISVYHRNYDTFVIFPMLVWLYGKIKSASTESNTTSQRTLIFFLAVCFGILTIPASGMQLLFESINFRMLTAARLEAILVSLCLSLLIIYGVWHLYAYEIHQIERNSG